MNEHNSIRKKLKKNVNFFSISLKRKANTNITPKIVNLEENSKQNSICVRSTIHTLLHS